MSRYSAFAIHLGISLLIFLALSAVIVLRWYPDYFFELDGGWEGLRLILGVDLVLGPLLTLIVFNAAKPEIKTDMAIIGALQIACLAAGMYVVWSERPLALVYIDGHFYSMSADAWTEVNQPVPDLSGFPGDWPKRIAVELPTDVNELSEIRGSAFLAGTSMRVQSDFYVPMAQSDVVLSDEYPLEKIRQRDQDYGELVEWQKRHPGSLEDYAFFPLGTRYKYLFVGYRREGLEYAGLLYTPGPL